ncbi:MAG: hypothetical protein IPP10_19425 [Candidatus Competibacteraceae bacterium]|nr:hypothetical protein [Candidatus Competibacteraceae bacterium]
MNAEIASATTRRAESPDAIARADAKTTARLIYQHLRKMKEPVLSADLVRRRYTGWTNFDAVIAASGGWLRSDWVRGTVRALSREERQ